MRSLTRPRSHCEATLAPYASTYKPPHDHPRSDGPIHVTLALGEIDEQFEEGMEWEELVPNSQDVLDAVRSLRDGDGLADMQIDLPWELGNGTKPSGDGTIVVVGQFTCSAFLSPRREVESSGTYVTGRPLDRHKYPHLASSPPSLFRRTVHLPLSLKETDSPDPSHRTPRARRSQDFGTVNRYPCSRNFSSDSTESNEREHFNPRPSCDKLVTLRHSQCFHFDTKSIDRERSTQI